ncbi:AraC family transcriptional regulator [Anseongella ginsenosidimutans]|uniref:AraC family transcriptional regulator n=1 Tax=Anseongella ginsenosidimutans TaxID=496056 RepID=A0A4R3KTY1_9SPHI|nr:helix-turn-helix domain-containing protein [Anseongella ginsenosidimutans]QEC53518.1 AraC family transcriptional regulator [Anseongella ginsenosidimutans]TCS88420.1 AraC family transcriptional regulator [Anseongella ginsenosidimutans]
MKYQTYIPCDGLKPFVNAFAISETEAESSYKVLPDTGVVIGFQYRGRLSYTEDETEIPLSASGITGIRDRYRIFKNSRNIGTVLVFFKAGGAASFFKQPINELFRESVSLDNFIRRSDLLILEERICGAIIDEERIAIIEQFLLSRMKQDAADPLVASAISLLCQTKGILRIGELSKQLHTSQSVLEKRFRQIAGASPKKFASIVRFKHTLINYKATSSLTELSYESGFYDQAHFIKEFKQFTGETPEAFFTVRF